jgi:transcriptional regulator with PAS, ATPase and Fis domain
VLWKSHSGCPTDISVLVIGESGRKEFIPKIIHSESKENISLILL